MKSFSENRINDTVKSMKIYQHDDLYIEENWYALMLYSNKHIGFKKILITDIYERIIALKMKLLYILIYIFLNNFWIKFYFNI